MNKKIIFVFRNNQLFRNHLDKFIKLIPSEIIIEYRILKEGSSIESKENIRTLQNILNFEEKQETIIIVDNTCKKAILSLAGYDLLFQLNNGDNFKKYSVFTIDSFFSFAFEKDAQRTKLLSLVAKKVNNDPKNIFIVQECIADHDWSLISLGTDERKSYKTLLQEERVIEYTKLVSNFLVKLFPNASVKTYKRFNEIEDKIKDNDLLVIDRHVSIFMNKYIYKKSDNSIKTFPSLVLPTETTADIIGMDKFPDYDFDFSKINSRDLPWVN